MTGFDHLHYNVDFCPSNHFYTQLVPNQPPVKWLLISLSSKVKKPGRECPSSAESDLRVRGVVHLHSRVPSFHNI